MSGDYFSHNDQQPPLPCKASQAMDEIKEDLWRNTNYVLEIESMFVQARWRNDSPLRE